MLARRILVLLDVFFGVLSGLHAIEVVLQTVIRPGEVPKPVLLVVLLATLLMLTAWVTWRLTHWRWPLLVLAVAAFVTSIGGSNSMTLLLILLSLALVVLGYGWATGLLALCLEALAWTMVMRYLYHRPWSAVAAEMIGSTLLLGLGCVLGMVLLELQGERTRNHELMARSRRSAETEKELMLADERSRSARELHDGLGHRLTLIQLSLEYAERMRERAPDRAFAEVSQARDTAREALAYMRRWVRALNPPRETNLSGTRAFEAIADSFRGTGLDIIVDHTGAERELDRDTSLFAYRMVQEGLTNVVRHSKADRVSLTVGWHPDRIDLELRDNGGLPAGDPTGGGFGLRSLAERAAELGGTFATEVTENGLVLSGSVPTKDSA